MSKHTKGEWFCKREGFSTVYVEARIGGGLLQEVAACGPTANGSEEQEANARLMAASPRLLAALKSMIDSYQYEASQENPALLEAKAAVFEATGGNHEEESVPHHLRHPLVNHGLRGA